MWFTKQLLISEINLINSANINLLVFDKLFELELEGVGLMKTVLYLMLFNVL